MNASVATLAGKSLTEAHLHDLYDLAKLKPVSINWLSKNKTVDVFLMENVGRVQLIFDSLQHSFFNPLQVDWIVQNPEFRKKKLLITDMDSTIIQNECIDEIADMLGLKSQVAAITEAAMNGRIDFPEALHRRVAMLKGLSVEKLQEVYDTRIRLMPGAEELISKMHDSGATCVLVSGGFTFFTEKIANRLGFHHHHANELGIENGKLTGVVMGDIVDKNVKVHWLKHYIKTLGLQKEETLALGDGANDIPMLLAAGLGIAYHAKEKVNQEVRNRIRFGDLSVVGQCV